MIKLKKKIKLKYKLIDKKLIPDQDVSYKIPIIITSKYIDIGFFDVLDDPNSTATPEIPTQPNVEITCNGTSRLVELEKYTTSTDLSVKYFTSTNINTNGLNVLESIENEKLVYYIDGFKYTDFITNEGTNTQIVFTSTGMNSDNFINKPIIKKENKSNIISQPFVNSDIFIDRQQISSFENNIKLKNIRNIVQLENYAGGGYFNIIENA